MAPTATEPPHRMPEVELDVRVSSDGLRREIVFSDGRPAIFFEHDPVLGTPPPARVSNDFALIAALPIAMRHGFGLRTAFPVDAVLLDGLAHFQEVWSRWRPDLFGSVVPVLPAEETLGRPALRRPPAAVAAFSSGVDSTFTLARHTKDLAGRGRRTIGRAVMVHGFDMPLDAVDGFRKLADAGRGTAEELGVPLHIVRTDWRSHIESWEMTFGVGLAAVLHIAGDGNDVGLIATEEAYQNAFPVWGNSFWSDRFFSGSSFRIESDGGAYDRIERLRLIAGFPSLVPGLRMCWAGPRTGDNCGLCPKCVLGKLGMLVAGVPEPWPFPQPLTVNQVRGMTLTTEWQRRFLRLMLARLDEDRSMPRDIRRAARSRLRPNPAAIRRRIRGFLRAVSR
jgi:hypothetical protein